MPRLSTPLGEYVCAVEPTPKPGSTLESALAPLSGTTGEPPALLYWNALTDTGAEVWWGLEGLDPVLATGTDLSGCVAVHRAALKRLVERRAIRSEAELARAIAVLVRGGAAGTVWCDGLLGVIRESQRGPLASDAGAATTAERITVALMVRQEAMDLGPFLSALAAQTLTGRTELLLIAEGLSSDALREVIHHVDNWNPKTIKVRRHTFGGDLPVAYLHNTVIGLASSEAVVFVDPRVAPRTPALVQTLADWAVSGGVAAACPRLERNGGLLAAGLSLATEAATSKALRVARDDTLAAKLRLTAAPHPWLFAANRRLWLESGGLRPTGDRALWTAGFATDAGPVGRTLLVGSEVAEWTAVEPPAGLNALVPAAGRLQAHAGRAVRAGPRSLAPGALRPRPVPVAPARATHRLHALTDEAGPGATRLLVVADALGASQAIAFELGLAEARRAGRVALTMIEEAALEAAPDPASLLEAEIQAAQPDVLVASRLGQPAVWAALRSAADRRRLPLMFHIDDDLLDLPLSSGIERYRLARAPRRLATLQAALETADLVMASTPLLAAKLKRYAPGARVYALSAGAAATPAPRGAARRDERLRVGYMASASHDADLAMIAPALNTLLEQRPDVDVELFGSIAKQPAADLLVRVAARHPIVQGDYAAFKRRLADLRWDIGLAPLRPIGFNRLKTPIKWAEYAEAGAAVLGSALEPYDPMAAEGAALTVHPEGWAWALRRLTSDAALRNELVAQADRLLARRYGWARLQQEIEGALREAVTLRQTRDRPRAAA